MDFYVFKQKLTELNPNLYIDEERQVKSINPRGTSGIYIKNFGTDKIDTSVLSGDQLKLAERFNDRPDEYIGWVAHGYVTEGDEFNEYGKLISPGWRSILKSLLSKNYITKEKAKKVFGWEKSDYDRMSLDQRRVFEANNDSSNSNHRIH